VVLVQLADNRSTARTHTAANDRALQPATKDRSQRRPTRPADQRALTRPNPAMRPPVLLVVAIPGIAVLAIAVLAIAVLAALVPSAVIPPPVVLVVIPAVPPVVPCRRPSLYRPSR